MTERNKGRFQMTKPVRIPIYKTVDGQKKLVGYREYDADISKKKTNQDKLKIETA